MLKTILNPRLSRPRATNLAYNHLEFGPSVPLNIAFTLIIKRRSVCYVHTITLQQNVASYYSSRFISFYSFSTSNSEVWCSVFRVGLHIAFIKCITRVLSSRDLERERERDLSPQLLNAQIALVRVYITESSLYFY